jgi:hypothetical protein
LKIQFIELDFSKIKYRWIGRMLISDARTGGARGALEPPIFGRSVKPIPTRGGQIIPNFSHLPA